MRSRTLVRWSFDARRIVTLTLALIVSGTACCAVADDASPTASTPPAANASADGKIDFARQVQPIFAARCYSCHDAEKHESGLRLDDRDRALAGGEGGYGPAIIAGKSAESVLIQAVTGTHAALERMPPEGPALAASEIETLRRWIDEGANWPKASSTKAADDHWAFRAPVRAAPPEVTNTGWPRSPIDRFVLGHIEQAGLTPATEADRVTLLRRLSLDLVGLPPTIEEIDAFLADTSDGAYERQVERLLASPHYGERWGRHWLDAARYADSDGYEKDKSRNVWLYRDWVIGALNADMPYDQFIVEQLAGDLLPAATQDQVVATGFLRNSMLNEEGGVDPEQFRMDAMFDRMDAVGKCILGLSIQCAQCHSHKFDPFTQEDYYRLFAYLNNDHEPTVVAYRPDELMQCNQLRQSIDAIDEDLRHRTPDWQERMASWEDELLAGEPQWTLIEPADYLEVGGGAKLSLLSDQSMLCAGYAPTHCTFRVTAKAPLAGITAVRLEALTNPNLPCRGPGRSFKGGFALTEIKIEAATTAEPDKKAALAIAAAAADFAQPEHPLEAAFDDRSNRKRIVGPIAWAFDGKDETAWGIDEGNGRRNQDRAAVFQLAEPVAGEETLLSVSLVQNHGGWNSDDHQNNLLGCFRLWVTTAPGAAARPPLPRALRDLLATPRDQRSPAQQHALFTYWRKSAPQWQDANQQIESLWAQWPAGSTALALKRRAELRPTTILVRGDFLKPSREVTPGVPSFLHPLPADAPANRLTLARWLADRRSPTTARSMVNRIWQAYFGTGLVSTSEEFGKQGDRPSHPELLDWLAVELMDQGWSLKAIHRQIVGSATYRQSSHVASDAYRADPQNRMLARGPRLRVEGEIVRDIALAASGLLNPALGGPSVYPPIPDSVLLFSYGPMTWNAETGPNRYRRALYTFRRRSIPFPALQNFDTPNGDFSCVRRARSNTPLQALTSLNEVIFAECAQALAKRTLRDGGATDAERLTWAFRRCVARPPEADELAELTRMLEAQTFYLGQGWTSQLIVATGKQTLPEDLPAAATPTQLAAYTLVSRVLLNLDETVTKE